MYESKSKRKAMESDDELQDIELSLAEIEEGDDEGGSEGSKYFRWTTDMDKVMLEILREHRGRMRKEDKNFSKEIYDTVSDALRKEFNINVSQAKMVNRLKTLKKDWGLAQDLLTRKVGFSWNDDTKKIEANREAWDRVAKTNHKYKQIRGKELCFLDILRDIYDIDQANGETNKKTKRNVQYLHVEARDLGIRNAQSLHMEARELGINDIDELLGQNGTEHFTQTLPSFKPLQCIETSPSPPFTSKDNSEGPKVTLASSPPLASKHHSESPKTTSDLIDFITEEMKGVKDAIKEVAHAIRSTNRRIRSEDEIVKELMRMGFEGSLLLDMVDFLVADPVRSNTFFALPVKLRKNWLRRKLTW